MQQQLNGNNRDPAPRNENYEFVAHAKAFHQSAAMHAARMVKFQYSKESKSQFRRECVDHLKASLSSGSQS